MTDTGQPRGRRAVPTRRRALKKDRRNRRFRKYGTYLVVIVASIVIAVLIRNFLFTLALIPSESMDPTLKVGDRVGVEQITGRVTDLERGDIVVFQDPGGWLPAGTVGNEEPLYEFFVQLQVINDDHKNLLVKRVIGLPGDHVVVGADGVLTVNDKPVHETYLKTAGTASTVPFDVTVPADHMWVMGDNRANSADSRFHMNDEAGPFIPLDLVRGRAAVILWPLAHMKLLPPGE